MASLVSYALTDLYSVKETLGIDPGDHSWDNLIIRKINQATDMIEGYCQRRFKNTTYTQEIYDGAGIDMLLLRQYPLTNTTPFVLEARASALNLDDWQTIPADQYFTDANAGVVRAVLNFFGNYDRWRVTYSAGFVTIPNDLAEACVTLASYLTVEDPSASAFISQKREGSRQISYAQGSKAELFDELNIAGILDQYSKYVISGER